jgi:hypothetical protein
MLSTDVLFVALAPLVALVGARVLLPFLYRPGRQVEFRAGRGSGTGEILGLSGLRLRVRSMHSGREHAVPLTCIRRR